MSSSSAPRPARFRRGELIVWLIVAGSYLAAGATGGMLVWLLSSRDAGPAGVPAGTRMIPDPVRTAPEAYAWTDQPDPLFPIPPYARFLEGVTIVLDPGHVGQNTANRPANWKTGPTGLREAEVNLRVAQYLREFLFAAGANPLLTRDRDRNLGMEDEADLRARAEMANERRADLLLSIHHNAGPDPQANHSALFYHLGPDQSPASLCAARYLLTGLSDALRLPQHLECAVLSDQLLYKEGFAVLRFAQVPAVLSEASFHSNPEEEERLRDPVYNRREAYGLFLGLARWAQAGLPRVKLLPPAPGASPRDRAVVVALDDGLSMRGGWGDQAPKISERSLTVLLNGEAAPYKFDAAKRQVRVTLPAGARPARGVLFVDFANIFGQHVLHPALELRADTR